MKVEIEFLKRVFKYDFEMINSFGFKNVYEGFKIDYSKGRRVYLVATNSGIPYTSFYKNMNFNNGKVTVKFNKDEIVIGTYKEVK